MDLEQFKNEYAAARSELEAGELTDAGAVRTQLRELADRLTSDRHRQIAYGLIDQLQAPPPATGESPEMTEALHILDSTDFESGPTERRLTALADARRRIWAIADRAGPDSGTIRGLTRGLESTETRLTEGTLWDNRPPAGTRRSSTA